jgi:hypothetical protein
MRTSAAPPDDENVAVLRCDSVDRLMKCCKPDGSPKSRQSYTAQTCLKRPWRKVSLICFPLYSTFHTLISVTKSSIVGALVQPTSLVSLRMLATKRITSQISVASTDHLSQSNVLTHSAMPNLQ